MALPLFFNGFPRNLCLELFFGVPIFEPGLEALVAKNVQSGRLSFTTDIKEAVKDVDAVFIAVGTPARRGDGHADLSYVYAAATEIAGVIEGFTMIVTKSTVPVGTGDEVAAIIEKTRPGLDVAVVSNPEFLREGAAIADFKRPDRVVVGTDDERAVELMKQLYRPLYLNETPILFTDRRTSELIKYAGNAFLATKITFINEIADLCEKVGANVQEVSRGIGLDGRIGRKFLNAGPGYGGSCFPKDTLAVVRTAQEAGAPLKIVETVEQVNKARKKAMATKIIAACGGSVQGKHIAVLGLAFKPNIDDLRESPALKITQQLSQELACKVIAVEPNIALAEENAKTQMLTLVDLPTALAQADVVVLLVDHDEFKQIAPTELTGKQLVDKGAYLPDENLD